MAFKIKSMLAEISRVGLADQLAKFIEKVADSKSLQAIIGGSVSSCMPLLFCGATLLGVEMFKGRDERTQEDEFRKHCSEIAGQLSQLDRNVDAVSERIDRMVRQKNWVWGGVSDRDQNELAVRVGREIKKYLEANGLSTEGLVESVSIYGDTILRQLDGIEATTSKTEQMVSQLLRMMTEDHLNAPSDTSTFETKAITVDVADEKAPDATSTLRAIVVAAEQGDAEAAGAIQTYEKSRDLDAFKSFFDAVADRAVEKSIAQNRRPLFVRLFPAWAGIVAAGIGLIAYGIYRHNAPIYWPQDSLQVSVTSGAHQGDLAAGGILDAQGTFNISTRIPPGVNATMFLLSGEGTLEELASVRAESGDRSLGFPGTLTGSHETEFVFVCLNREKLPGVQDFKDIPELQKALPVLPDGTLMRLTRSGIKAFGPVAPDRGGRGIVKIDPAAAGPLYQAENQLEAISTILFKQAADVQGIAFSH